MQTLYAFDGGEGDDFKNDQKFLLQSIEQMYDLHLLMLSLLIEVQKRAEDYQGKSQKKILATQEEKNPNRKFINNQVLQILNEDVALQNAFEKRKIDHWYLDFEYVDIIFKSILESDLYKTYMSSRVSDFKEDKNFIIDVFTEIIAPNDKLYEYIEDQKLTWLDDLPVVNTGIQKMLRKLKKENKANYFTPSLFKDTEDKEFATALFQKTLLNKSKFNQEIAAKTKNWDAERIANLDAVLLQMAICEFQKFPSIPVKVTINEYIDIAKEYSTPKSSFFINGILDKIVKEYKSNGELNKIGRGLM
ncbi:transcription antitermination factor NusB [Gelidibacter gilvus]|uniref:Transcription antitermination factor NusB n=2 Tax=Gelidibacter maritimus TaxID=2761487 RepID=A0A7W2M801_9FLAO|nr:transcription antitermination factor NusB [Gelidibacter maritimus]